MLIILLNGRSLKKLRKRKEIKIGFGRDYENAIRLLLLKKENRRQEKK